MATIARGKRYRADVEKVPQALVSVVEAVKVLKQFKATKFDQTVELVVWLGIDPKQADQAIRGSISLPHGIGKSKKVIAFCDDATAEVAKAAGAIEAGADALIDKINKGWTDFDVAVATPGMMRSVSRLGRVLGPQGKMPSPKSGTVVDDIATAVKEYAAGKIEFRNDDGGNIHAPVGKLSFDDQKLSENIETFLNRLRAMKPASSKGTYIKKAVLTATMSPSVGLAV
jgi:large subunit ribosomal protein L1